VGNHGNYWSSESVPLSNISINLNLQNLILYVLIQWDYSAQSNGFSVRCVCEE
jgi:hypothetical protein